MDNWTQRTNLYLGKIRIHIVCQKLQTLWTTGRNGQTYNQGTLESISVCQKLQTLWTTGCSGQICNKGTLESISVCQKLRTLWTTGHNRQIYNQGTLEFIQCVKNSGHCGQLDPADKSREREHQNPNQCVKNHGHCGQLDAVDKSVISEDQILISVSKLVDVADT